MYEKLSELLEKYDISIPTLANKIGVGKQVFYNWKKGITSPSDPTLQLLSEYFNVPVSYFGVVRNAAVGKRSPSSNIKITIEASVEEIASLINMIFKNSTHVDMPEIMDAVTGNAVVKKKRYNGWHYEG